MRIDFSHRRLWALPLAVSLLACWAAFTPERANAQYPGAYWAIDPTTGELCGQYGQGNSEGALSGSTTGPLLTNAWVYVIFWGSYWSKNPTPSAASIAADLKGLVGSSFPTIANQYGVQSFTFGGYNIFGPNTGNPKTTTVDVPSTVAPNGAPNGSAVTNNEIQELLDEGELPGPPLGEGYQSFYCIVMPPGVSDATNVGGAHSYVNAAGTVAVQVANETPYDVTATAYVDYASGENTSVVGTPNETISEAFSHEMLEAATNPLLGTMPNWYFPQPRGDEIVDVSSVTRSDLITVQEPSGPTKVGVEAAWSKAIGQCVIPFGSAQLDDGNNVTSYYDAADGTPHIFYLSQSEHIIELYWAGNTWATRDLTAQLGAVPANGAGSLASSWLTGPGFGSVFYEGTDSNIYEMVRFSWGWALGNLTATATRDAPPGQDRVEQVGFSLAPAYGLTTYYDTNAGVEHVDYVGQDTIVDLYSGPNSFWQADQLHMMPGASQLTSLYDDGDAGHVFYISSGGHVIEAYAGSGSTTWYSTDWSAMSGQTVPSNLAGTDALTSISEPLSGFGSTSAAVRHLYYATSAGHIYQITQVTSPYGNWWYGEDLTPAATELNLQAATSYFGEPVGLSCYMDGSGRIHVLYTDVTYSVHELVRTSMSAGTPGFHDTWTSDNASGSAGGGMDAGFRALTSVNVPGSIPSIFYLTDRGGSVPYWEQDVTQLWNPSGTTWASYPLTGTGVVGSNGPFAVP